MTQLSTDSPEYIKFIDDQWSEFQKNTDLNKVPDIDDDTLRDLIIKDLTFVSAMDVKEYTLYQKWCEVHEKFPTIETNSFFDDKPALKDAEQGSLIQEVKNNLWFPEDPMDYVNLEPEVVWTDNDSLRSITGKKMPAICNTMRTFISSMKNNSNIGRNLNFIIQDKPTGKFLGVICMSSDFLDLTPRDKHIGWDRKRKIRIGNEK